ncbi:MULTISPECIES: 2-C-methyl-D-erythritol 4-phosphate cytidylyltransferase [Staphylococcaceae]|uniref:2-C-methyl-D-erythritol 4-phosphate cytidylyltransferase n=1 Tax=Macrococcus psychrotolerans TaxID=3039389 RepID=A0AAT9P583_9STAP|nr:MULTISPECIES: 2-C-methyl-D-erythritol 4-phosphate cytidylyltransferase [Macrococcus]MDJ1112130.1 2-C-methyl-D-erythritol 4-phosphate cytidylyltransferase [Macrococcus sp. S115]QYA32784.1 2-C-methyl-D-erythritol 4-phosphate cytidylyltransferase [Macrococcus sp. 19Msa1099]QYA37596.1 2-C-methyl-D-erythritol 4-phosphate cytidylyltransferase [Macrococcus caseolyticus]QYA76303.1 2-C-methyl-D-erythritol 4-phosphate cytidylyltransferase [Macrococcus caseolyticus]
MTNMYDVIIPAAGMGKRMQADKNKVLLQLQSKSILEHTLETFQSDDNCRAIHLAAQKDELEMLKAMSKAYNKIEVVTVGGSERQYSIYNVLKAIQPCDYVFIHDAARPFVTPETLYKLYTKVQQYKSVVAAVKVKDTVKRVIDFQVEETLNREELWQIQTPQAFSYHLLLEAYNKADEDDFLGTDDASLVERLYPVNIVESDYDNIKITTPEDMFFAEAILKKRGI